MHDPARPFAPVPSRTGRHDGWTPERQAAFIAALARDGRVCVAARAVGLSAKSAYALRRRPGAADFARVWAGAVNKGWTRHQQRRAAREAAVSGDRKPRGV